MSSATSMIWNPQLYLPPSPTLSNKFSPFGKLACYATPPLSPLLLGQRPEFYDPEDGVFDMSSSGLGPYNQTSYTSQRGYPAYQDGQRYFQSTTRETQQISSSFTPQTTGPLNPDPYSFGQGQATQYISAPLTQNNTLRYEDPEYPPVNQRQSHYPAYCSNLVYNIPENAGQGNLGYDTVPQYPSRQTTGVMNVFDDHLGVAQQYFNTASEPSSAVPACSSMHYQTQEQISFPASSTFSSLVSQRTSGVTIPYKLLGVTKKYQSQDLMPSYIPEALFGEAPYGDKNLEPFAELAKKAFWCIKEGKLMDGAQTVLELSTWLVKEIPRLGLDRDDALRKQQRLQLWKDFNYCWLTLFQKQKEISQSNMPSQNSIDLDFLRTMADELTRICDQLEKDGLVDYELGIWEEEIMDVLIDCIQILEGENPGYSSDLRQQITSRSRRLS